MDVTAQLALTIVLVTGAFTWVVALAALISHFPKLALLIAALVGISYAEPALQPRLLMALAELLVGYALYRILSYIAERRALAMMVIAALAVAYANAALG